MLSLEFNFILLHSLVFISMHNYVRKCTRECKYTHRFQLMSCLFDIRPKEYDDDGMKTTHST